MLSLFQSCRYRDWLTAVVLLSLRPASVPAADETLPGYRAGEVHTFNDQLQIKMVWCPPGEFTMGGTDGDQEKPPHQVTLTHGFWLGQTEVTQAQWQAVMTTTPWQGKDFVCEGADYPASYLSDDDAVAFCNKLTEQERRAGRLSARSEYRLPTEAQWEYACRAGTKTRFSFGDNESRLGEYEWFFKSTWDALESYPQQVATRIKNPWNLYDMHGNVQEWCRDWYDSEYYSRSDTEDPENRKAGEYRAIRGGCWGSVSPLECSSAGRGGGRHGCRYVGCGFRIARTSW